MSSSWSCSSYLLTLEKVDLRAYNRFEPRKLWNKLASAQKYSLSMFAYEMKRDDVIYVRFKGGLIAKGLIKGQYFFDFDNGISDLSGESLPWAHQRRVKWQTDFPRISAEGLGPVQYTIWKLTPEQTTMVNQRIKEALKDPGRIDLDEQDELEKSESNRDISKILNDLRNLKATLSERIEIHNKVYKRDDKTIVQLKIV